MDDLVVELQKTNLEDIASEVHYAELGASLKALEVDGGKNYAIFERDGSYPAQGISILPKPAVPPSGATTICEGSLMIASVEIEVEAFRLAKDEGEQEASDDEAESDGLDETPETNGESEGPPAIDEGST